MYCTHLIPNTGMPNLVDFRQEDTEFTENIQSFHLEFSFHAWLAHLIVFEIVLSFSMRCLIQSEKKNHI